MRTGRGVLRRIGFLGVLLTWLIMASPVFASTGKSFSSVSTAAKYVRKQMVQRQEILEFDFKRDGMTQDGVKKLVNDIVEKAYEETDSPQEGDYLRFHVYSLYKTYSYRPGGVTDSTHVTLKFTYNSTKAQETSMSTGLKQVVSNLDLEDASDLEKVKKIHDYLCRNVTYRDNGILSGGSSCHSAYSALYTGKTVCQGYATAFYALCKSCDVDVRCIWGWSRGQDHLWNIVKIGTKWYNMDCTWDDLSTISYTYFLKNETEFADHQREASYLTTEFVQKYPVTTTSFVTMTEAPVMKKPVLKSSTKVQLDWTPVESSTGYMIWMSTSKTGKFRRAGILQGGGKKSVIITDLSPGQTYYFKISAYNDMFQETVTTESAVRSIKMTPCTPTVKGVVVTATSARIKWKKVSDSKGYEVQLKDSKGSRKKYTVSKKKSSCRMTGLKPNYIYYVYVRSYVKKASGQKVYSRYSTKKRFVTGE